MTVPAQPVGPHRLRWLLGASHVPPGGSLGGIVRYTVELARALGRREDVELHLTATPDAADDLRALVGDGAVHVLARVPGAAEPLLERYGPVPPGFDVVQGVKHLLPARLPRRGPAGRSVRPASSGSSASSRPVTALTVHDMILLDRPGDFGLAKRTLLQRPYRASLREADVPLCVSAATRARLGAWEPAAARRAAVTPLASSPTLLGVAAAPVPELAALVAAGRPFALVVGDPSARKNVPLVVAAWARVVQERPDAVLALVGPPSWGASSYGEQAADLEAAGQLVRLVAVPDAALRWAYEHAAVALCPSLVEGFGLPVVEALDLGAPVVVSSDPALAEAAAGRAEAVLAPDDSAAWAEQVLRVLAAPRPRGRAPAAPPRSWADVAEDTVAAVRSALAARG